MKLWIDPTQAPDLLADWVSCRKTETAIQILEDSSWNTVTTVSIRADLLDEDGSILDWVSEKVRRSLFFIPPYFVTHATGLDRLASINDIRADRMVWWLANRWVT